MSSLFDIIDTSATIAAYSGRTESGNGPSRISSPRIIHQNHSGTGGCANLAVARGKVSLFSALETPWHKLGIVVDRAATAGEALQLANLAGWDLQKIQQFARFRGTDMLTATYAIVRGDTGAYLGSVGARYQIVSNESCFEIMDEIIGQAGASYETAGALGKGETAWMLAKMPNGVEIKGDEVIPYLLCSTSHDGTASIRIAPTMTRVVCQNTHRVAMREIRGKGICLRHTTNVKNRVNDARKALGFAQKAVDTFAGHARQLAETQLYPHEFFAGCLDDILDITVADKAVTSGALKDGSLLAAIADITSYSERKSESEKLERAKARRSELLDDILNRYETDRNNRKPGIEGTAWAALNAVTENIDHSPLWRANKDAESRFERVLLGSGDDDKQAVFGRALAMTAG